MWNYTEKVLEHFKNPHNFGEMKDADAVGEVGSMACGDALRLFLKVDKKTNMIVDAKFQTFGCGSAIASASALTDMVKGKTIEEAMKISNDQIAEFLGGLPKEKMHCSVMGKDALEAAVRNLKGEKAVVHEEDEGRIVCHCFGITEGKIRKVALENGLKTVEEVTQYTKAGGGCGNCKTEIEDIMTDIWGKGKPAPAKETAKPTEKKLTNIQRIQMIQEIIEHEIKPSLMADGGSIELVDVDGDRVSVSLRGTCSACIHAEATLKNFVEAKLREFVSPDVIVEEV